MTWLVEEPVYIAILGIITIAFLVFAWMQTGYRWMMHATLAVVALTIGLLLLENLVETDKEQVEAELHRIARDVETNDLDKILPHVYSGAPETLAEARAEFPRYTVSDVNIKRNLEIEIIEGESPPKAEVSFSVTVHVRDRRSGGTDYGTIPRFVRATLRKEAGRWKVAAYRHEDFRTPIMNLDQ